MKQFQNEPICHISYRLIRIFLLEICLVFSLNLEFRLSFSLLLSIICVGHKSSWFCIRLFYIKKMQRKNNSLIRIWNYLIRKLKTRNENFYIKNNNNEILVVPVFSFTFCRSVLSTFSLHFDMELEKSFYWFIK